MNERNEPAATSRGEPVRGSGSGGSTPRRRLDAHDRIAETLFGLIMVLTFTGSLSVAESGRDDVRAMLVAAIGCNVAWGIIDAMLYLMARLTELVSEDRLLRTVQAASEPAVAHRAIADAFPEHVGAVVGAAELEPLRRAILRLPPPPERRRLAGNDFLNAFGVFLWVVASVFPVAIPFLFMADAGRALRVSNAIAMAMLFVAGWAYGKLAGRSGWGAGIAMILVGAVLVGLTIALGG